MPIGDIRLDAPPVQNDNTALAFEALGAGLTSFQEARQDPNLPSYVLDDDQVREFGPSSEFTKKGLQLLNDETLTRPQKTIGLRQIHSQGNLVKPKEPTPQENIDARTVVVNGVSGYMNDKNEFKAFPNARGEDPEDAAKQQEKDLAEAFKRASAITGLDANANPIPPTEEDIMKQVGLIRRVRELMSAPVAPAIEPGGPTSGGVPGLHVAPLTEERVPETPEELAQLIQVKLEEFDAMSPEQRQATIQEMPDDELELFLEALPQTMKDSLDRAEADGDKERFMRILLQVPLFPEISGTAVGEFP